MANLLPAPLHRLGLRIAHRTRVAVWPILKPDLTSVSVIAYDMDGRVLLIRQSYGRRTWQFPGGGLHKGEAPEDGARRELREETGCKALSLSLVDRIEEPVLGASTTCHVFTAQVRDRPEADGREIIEARFFPLHSLPEPLGGKTRKRLAMLRDKTV
ncbi:NUDIX domain-containing protein [Altererythrobacter sp. HHU K3-1]|uniref:NUDIX domain-containing protein n=1 Tax=Qipengyuania atrilutea TaxID=2744473 RepID=A0A850H7F8_9SPHN|nr:NUDIX domain-containing protein [Actirhodobacter atriluteus]